jgi:protein CpxP
MFRSIHPKKTRRTMLLGACGALAIAAFATPILSQNAVMAQEFDQPMLAQGFDRPGNRGGRLLEELDLSDAQKQEIKAIHERGRNQSQPTRDQLRQAQEQLKNLMAGTASESAIRSQYAQVKALRQQMADIRFDHMLEVREVMTPAQRQEFAQLMESRREQWRSNRGNRNNRPGRSR